MVLTVVTADGRISEIRAVRANMRDLGGAQIRTAQGFFTFYYASRDAPSLKAPARNDLSSETIFSSNSTFGSRLDSRSFFSSASAGHRPATSPCSRNVCRFPVARSQRTNSYFSVLFVQSSIGLSSFWSPTDPTLASGL